MPSSYSTNLLLELMADGENEGLWGDIANENFEILGRAAGGVGGIALAGTTHTLTVAQGELSEGQYSTLVLGGSPTGTNTITIQPNTVTRTYLVQNSSGQDAVFTQGSGGNVTVPNGGTAIVFCSGTGASSSVTDITADFLRGVNNLSDLDDPDTALQNLGLTATAAEINKLDGATLDLAAVTATAAEVNVLDGATATTADLNKLADVTATAADLNKLDGFTGDVDDLNYAEELRATGVTASEFNKLDGLTATTTELNYTDGVTSNIQDQLDNKYEAETQSEATWEAGTSTTESLVSPAKVKAAVEALVPDEGFSLRTVDSGSLSAGFPVITGLPEDGWFLKLNDVTVGSSSTRFLTVRFSSDNGSSFYGWRTISFESFWSSAGVSGGISGSNPPSFQSVAGRSSSASFTDGLMVDATITAFDPSTKINALQLGFSNGQRSVSGGTYELIGGTRFAGWVGN